MSDKPIDAEVMPETQALAVRQQAGALAPSGLFGTSDPSQVIERAANIATALRAVILKQGLISNIQGKQYPKCEAWTLLGTMLGVFPVLVWSRQVEGGWEARVEARTKDGAIVGAAEAECLKTERNWANRDDFALRSMAQTRATAKCLRMPLGFVMTLSGFQPTPAEEMVSDHPQNGLGAKKGYQHTTPPVKTPPAPTGSDSRAAQPAHPSVIPFPTAKHRERMIEALKAAPGGQNRQTVTEYFRKVGPPHMLLPTEELEHLPLRFVPATKDQMFDLSAKIARFSAGDPATAAFPPHPEPTPPAPPAPPAPPVTALPKRPAVPDDEAWRGVIVPVPPKGIKRDVYLKHPETIGELFDLRHGQDEEAQAARQRLWGFVNHYEAKPWVGKDGKQRPPSATDVKFREALDAFALWFERNHPDEKL